MNPSPSSDVTDRAWALLESVPDPEIPVLSIVDLGIVHDVRDVPGGVAVDLLPTYTGCPATEVIESDVRAALESGSLGTVTVTRQLSPPWSTDRISAAGREKLLAYGIAPPAGKSGRRSVFAGDRPAACPRCGSVETARVSEFGSTPCKAAWRCEACLEPFEYFKCL